MKLIAFSSFFDTQFPFNRCIFNAQKYYTNLQLWTESIIWNSNTLRQAKIKQQQIQFYQLDVEERMFFSA